MEKPSRSFWKGRIILPGLASIPVRAWVRAKHLSARLDDPGSEASQEPEAPREPPEAEGITFSAGDGKVRVSLDDTLKTVDSDLFERRGAKEVIKFLRMDRYYPSGILNPSDVYRSFFLEPDPGKERDADLGAYGLATEAMTTLGVIGQGRWLGYKYRQSFATVGVDGGILVVYELYSDEEMLPEEELEIPDRPVRPAELQVSLQEMERYFRRRLVESDRPDLQRRKLERLIRRQLRRQKVRV
jgi:hypothetical protein